jgi:large subunit ribosomal protein L21e
MAKSKSIREKGKIPLSRIFTKFNEGDKVSLVHNLSFPRPFHERMQGRTGVIKGKRGEAYIIEIQDGKRKKTFMINQIHLKKIK